MHAPPTRAPTGFSFKRQSSSFSIRARNSKPEPPAEPPLLEDWIVAYDMPRDKLRDYLSKVVFPGHSFDGNKIRLKGDNLILAVPRKLNEEEKTEIYKLKVPGAS